MFFFFLFQIKKIKNNFKLFISLFCAPQIIIKYELSKYNNIKQ